MDPSDSASEPSTTSQFEFDATMTEQYKDMLDVSKLSLDANKSENPLRKTFYFIVYDLLCIWNFKKNSKISKRNFKKFHETTNFACFPN